MNDDNVPCLVPSGRDDDDDDDESATTGAATNLATSGIKFCASIHNVLAKCSDTRAKCHGRKYKSQ